MICGGTGHIRLDSLQKLIGNGIDIAISDI